MKKMEVKIGGIPPCLGSLARIILLCLSVCSCLRLCSSTILLTCIPWGALAPGNHGMDCLGHGGPTPQEIAGNASESFWKPSTIHGVSTPHEIYTFT